MNISLLSYEDRKRAYRLEELNDIGKEIHFSSDLVDDGTFLLKKKCNHNGGECIHEFGIYHSQYSGLIYFHRCDKCTYAVRINEEYYLKAKQIYDNGGDFID